MTCGPGAACWLRAVRPHPLPVAGMPARTRLSGSRCPGQPPGMVGRDQQDKEVTRTFCTDLLVLAADDELSCCFQLYNQSHAI